MCTDLCILDRSFFILVLLLCNIVFNSARYITRVIFATLPRRLLHDANIRLYLI